MACVFAAVAFVEAAVIGGVTWWLGSADTSSNTPAENNYTEAAFKDHIAQALRIKRISSIPQNLPAVGLQVTPFTAPVTPVAPGVTVSVRWEPPTSTYTTTLSMHELHQSALQDTITSATYLLLFVLITGLCVAVYHYICTHGLPSFSQLLSWNDFSYQALIQEITEVRSENAHLINDGREKDERIKPLQSDAEVAFKESKSKIQDLKSDKQDAKDEVSNLQQAAALKEKELKIVEAELTKNKGMLAEELAKSSAADEPEKSAKKAKKEQKAKTHAAQDIKAAGEKAQRAQEDLDAASEKIKALEVRVRDLETENGRATSELEGAKTPIEQFESKQGKLKEEIEKLKQSVQTQKKAKLEADDVADELRSQLEVVSGCISSLDVAIRQLEAERNELETNLDEERGLKTHLQGQVNELNNTLEGRAEQMAQLQAEKEKLEETIKDIDGKLEIEAEALADQFIGSIFEQTEARSTKLLNHATRLEKEVDYLRSQLCKVCRCKRSGSSKGRNKDGDDENDEEGPSDKPHTSRDDGTDDGRSSQFPESSKPDDDTAPGGNGCDTQAPKDTESSANGLSSQAPASNETDNATPQQEEEPDDGLSSQDHNPADDAEPASKRNNGKAGNWPAPTPCPLGRRHQGCTTMFIQPPGYDDMIKSKQRRTQLQFKKLRTELKCAYAAFSSLWPDAPLPPWCLQHSPA